MSSCASPVILLARSGERKPWNHYFDLSPAGRIRPCPSSGASRFPGRVRLGLVPPAAAGGERRQSFVPDDAYRGRHQPPEGWYRHAAMVTAGVYRPLRSAKSGLTVGRRPEG